jgi:hypothetical protein
MKINEDEKPRVKIDLVKKEEKHLIEVLNMF